MIGLLVLTALVGGAGCSSEPGDPADSAAVRADATLRDDTVTVASFDFAESELLAEIYSQALEADGYDVQREFGLGPREFVLPALTAGLVEVVPEYAGSALRFASLTPDAPAADGAAASESLGRLLEGGHVTVLDPSPAEDANAFVVTSDTAAENDLDTLSDVVDLAPEMTFGGPPECASRPFCLAGLERVYGLSFREVLTLDAGGPLTHQALENGDVEIALLFTTDPSLTGGGLVELEDDRDLQPPENVTPLIRTEVVDRFGPDLVAQIDEVSERLTTDGLRDLNGKVANGDDPASVAKAWLADQGLT